MNETAKQPHFGDLSSYEAKVMLLVRAAVDLEEDCLYALEHDRPGAMRSALSELYLALAPFRNTTWPQGKRFREAARKK